MLDALGDRPSPMGSRERDILTLITLGATDEVIARRLQLSRRTVLPAAPVLERSAPPPESRPACDDYERRLRG
jgi:regulatory LuxR family protein